MFKFTNRYTCDNFDCHLGGINIAMEDANEAHLWVCL